MDDPDETVACEPGGADAVAAAERALALPTHIGRYRVEKVLGKGGFGVVYLAHDDQLHRRVAIKVPHRKLVTQTEDAEAYLVEARTVANLDHPNIVPVYDVGGTEQFPCYVVSKFIEGRDLKAKIQASRLSLGECAELVAAVAEALHYAHKQGIIHRDIKPGNILLDTGGKPYVADFGLALREQDIGQGPRYAGTPAYMSPEQARGEGHRVDGRSDTFSLGVVLYELLTGRRPFYADSSEELLDQIASFEPRPPRQIDDTVPKELDRICLKALSKRASERYSAARDMGDDLRQFLADASSEEKSTVTGWEKHEGDAVAPMPSPVPTTSGQQAVKIVPKGLRSFDAADADFFLELLPGPRDRDGLPESIRFWKSRIETTDLDSTFSVGLIYGPSGCGKSSLVKAGLLPRLVKSVAAIYVEATAEETEARLLRGLRRQLPELPADLGLIESLAALRQGRFLSPGQKVLLVLDQFEQPLHAKRGKENAELVQALRHCDGGRLQCIVLVRDDFWLAVSRFMGNLEVELVQGRNVALVDLFDLRHARKVLTAFGRAFSAIPEEKKSLTKDQNAFLDQAIAGLAQDGKIVSVRLALFAEMVKGKPWVPITLKEVGGIEGVGVTFLEETFTASTALPQHRLHQKAAQAVLKALLPETGTDIKGNMRSQQELLEASGYTNRLKDFSELLRVLDTELRLLTPTDPEGKDEADESMSVAQRSGKYYQLTHDYLVHSLRDWLARKLKQTRRGRAELRLAERAALWNAKPENRHLPSWWEWAGIRLFTRKKSWTLPQRRMLLKAGRHHVLRGMALLVLLVLLGWAGREGFGRLKAHALRDRLVNANTVDVPLIVADMAPYHRWLDPLLHDACALAEKEKDSRKELHASLALLPVDPSQVRYLYGQLLDAQAHEVPVIRDALAPHKDQLLDNLWTVVASPEMGKEPQRLRAAAALAKYDAESERWRKANRLVVNDLVLENPVFLGQWSEAFRPVKHAFLAPLAEIFRDRRVERSAERSLATNLLADYAADTWQVLAGLLMDADVKQFAVIYPKFKNHGEQGLPLLTGEINKKLPSDLPSSDERREKLAKRQANAAAALLKMNQPENVWPLLKHSSDPRVRSYLVHRLGPLGADSGAIVRQLDEEPDVTIRRALLLSLGEYGEKALSPEARKSVLPKLQEIYRNDADPGLHAAAEWLLRTWNQAAWLKQVNEAWAKDKGQRDKRLEGVRQMLAQDKANGTPLWYVNSQGQTLIVIPGPVEFMMGSPSTEVARDPDERQHRRRIGRTFAIAAKAVTVTEYWRFDRRHTFTEQYAPAPDCPVVQTSWFHAAAYCNWLSQQEGLPANEWCYEPLVDPKAMTALAGSSVGLLAGPMGPMGPLAGTYGLLQGRTEPQFKEGMKLARNYLQRSGYRLPTEAEMEYAARAGAATSRYFGEAEDLLEKYAWYQENSTHRTWPVGSKKPNDLGLFDMHGNVFCWCQGRYNKEYPQGKQGAAVDDTEDLASITIEGGGVVRGGSFLYQAPLVRCAFRLGNVFSVHGDVLGFRLARTLTP